MPTRSLWSRTLGTLWENAGPLVRTYAKGVERTLRPPPVESLPERAPEGLTAEVAPRRAARDRIADYLAATDGADLPYLRGRLLPPLFFTTLGLRPFLELLRSDQLPVNFLGLVHTENDLIVHRPVLADERVGVRVDLAELTRDEERLRLTISCQCRVADELASESRGRFIMRLGRNGTRRPPRPEVPPPVPGWLELRTFALGAGVGRRYGSVSGDFNPIHLSALTSQVFGFRRPIAHGFCLKAMIGHALVRTRARGEPGALRRLNIRFKKPVPLPSQARLTAEPGRQGRFLLVSAQDGRVQAEGEFELAG